ncbi:hypothetical protein C8R45DRAFT_1084631 [Mycena sanguinolenta]|nr:hypothetical protein C8R45DRAFT_1084631 [Mycena sanguinolenta]
MRASSSVIGADAVTTCYIYCSALSDILPCPDAMVVCVLAVPNVIGPLPLREAGLAPEFAAVVNSRQVDSTCSYHLFARSGVLKIQRNYGSTTKNYGVGRELRDFGQTTEHYVDGTLDYGNYGHYSNYS